MGAKFEASAAGIEAGATPSRPLCAGAASCLALFLSLGLLDLRLCDRDRDRRRDFRDRDRRRDFRDRDRRRDFRDRDRRPLEAARFLVSFSGLFSVLARSPFLPLLLRLRFFPSFGFVVLRLREFVRCFGGEGLCGCGCGGSGAFGGSTFFRFSAFNFLGSVAHFTATS